MFVGVARSRSQPFYKGTLKIAWFSTTTIMTSLKYGLITLFKKMHCKLFFTFIIGAIVWSSNGVWWRKFTLVASWTVRTVARTAAKGAHGLSGQWQGQLKVHVGSLPCSICGRTETSLFS